MALSLVYHLACVSLSLSLSLFDLTLRFYNTVLHRYPLTHPLHPHSASHILCLRPSYHHHHHRHIICMTPLACIVIITLFLFSPPNISIFVLLSSFVDQIVFSCNHFFYFGVLLEYLLLVDDYVTLSLGFFFRVFGTRFLGALPPVHPFFLRTCPPGVSDGSLLILFFPVRVDIDIVSFRRSSGCLCLGQLVYL